MKSIGIILIQLFYMSLLFSQNLTWHLYAEDNVGNRDTVTYGFNEMSKIGVDPNLGEKNIFDEPNDSLEMRFILRDSLNLGCLSLNFSKNIDLKTDFRPFIRIKDGYSQFYSLANVFELNIKATNYPVTITSDFSEILYYDWSFYNLYKNNCEPYLTYEGVYRFDNDTLIVLPDSSFSTIVLNMSHEVGIENFTPPNWIISPNPSKQRIKLTGFKSFGGTLEMFDVIGKKLLTNHISNNKEIIIDIDNFANGIYFIKYISKDKSEISVRKLIKE